MKLFIIIFGLFASLSVYADSLSFTPDESLLKQFILSGATHQDFDSEFYYKTFNWRVLRATVNELKTAPGKQKLTSSSEKVTNLQYTSSSVDSTIAFKASLNITAHDGPLCLTQVIELSGTIKRNSDGAQEPILNEFIVKPDHTISPVDEESWYQCV